jgi:PAS domain S-box-containing protein
MKISHKLICGYLTIALLTGFAGYLSFKSYNDIKYKFVQLNENSVTDFRSSNELLLAIEKCQTSAQDIIKNRYRIIYKPPENKQIPKPASVLEEMNIKTNLVKLEQFLSNDRQGVSYSLPDSQHDADRIYGEKLKEWLNLRKNHFYYHWKYLSHFISLSDQEPNEAYSFFKKTLEPHYRENIYPIISQYRKTAQEQMEIRIRQILNEYIPNAGIIIILSTVGTLFTVIFLGIWTSRSISRPIRQLTHAALDIGKGHLNTKVSINSSDEIGILAQAFKDMAHDLGQTTVSKSYVDNIIKSMLDALIVVDVDLTITKVNQSALNLLGYDRYELVGKSINSVIVEEPSSPHSNLGTLMQNCAISNLEKVYLTRDGREIPVLFSGAVMYGDNREIQGIVCAARDIVERKEAEVALQRAYDEMEQRVEERTAALLQANKQLQHEIEKHQRAAKALRESKNRLRFLSSHILKAQEKERRRISLELHDELGQSLSLLKMKIGSIQRKWGGKQPGLAEPLGEAKQHIDFTIENVRRLSRDLSPSILDDLGLSAAIDWLLNDFERYYDIDTNVETSDIDNCFSAEKQIVIYRIVQEALTNIAKHAGAGRVDVLIKSDGGRVLFSIQDNGRGFDYEAMAERGVTERGLGLTAMYERALMLGSSLEIQSKDREGTQISFSVPASL